MYRKLTYFTSSSSQYPGGRGTPPPLNKLRRYVPPETSAVLVKKTGLDFDIYGLKSGMALKGTTRAYKSTCTYVFVFLTPMNNRDREATEIHHSN